MLRVSMLVLYLRTCPHVHNDVIKALTMLLQLLGV